MRKVCLSLSLFFAAAFLFSCGEDTPIEPVVYGDDESPSIRIQVPTSGTALVTLESHISIGGAAYDNKGISGIEWSSGSLSGEAGGAKSWTIDSIPLEYGDNIITVTAYDEELNSGSDEITVTRNRFTDFYGKPLLDPSDILRNNPTEVLVRANLSVNPGLAEDGVTLVRVDDNNNVLSEVCRLYDDGDLNHGDDILGDNVFSAIHTFEESDLGGIRLRALARTIDGGSEAEEFSAVFTLKVVGEVSYEEFEELIDIQAEAVTRLNENFTGRDPEAAIDSALLWLNRTPGVSSAYVAGNNIRIRYESGLEGGLLILELGENGTSVYRSAPSVLPKRAPGGIPINTQTRGLNCIPGTAYLPNDIILDRDVLIYAPFEIAFSPYNEGPELAGILNGSDLGFDLKYISDQECTVSELYDLAEFGYVVFATHGSMGEDIITGEIVTEENRAEYANMIRDNRIRIWTCVTYDRILWTFSRNAEVYGVTPSFISSLSGTFPNSIIINNSCESAVSSSLEDAFMDKGAKTYFGYDNTVSNAFAAGLPVDITRAMVNGLLTTGEAFTDGLKDPLRPNAEFEMSGSGAMRFTLSFFNGDFETGNLAGWSREGDGRVISRLGTQYPRQGIFMGIVSTGLGYTTESGSISQAFRVEEGADTLSLRWNFISEEFLEWVGNSYQDYFTIKIIDSGGGETVVFSKTIDEFYDEYELTRVSPQIVFDQGDAYMTGWQDLSYNIEPFAGQIIDLILSVGDVQDSNFDSAALVDDIVFE